MDLDFTHTSATGWWKGLGCEGCHSYAPWRGGGRAWGARGVILTVRMCRLVLHLSAVEGRCKGLGCEGCHSYAPWRGGGRAWGARGVILTRREGAVQGPGLRGGVTSVLGRDGVFFFPTLAPRRGRAPGLMNPMLMSLRP
eukprot:scaffold9640_cov105-Isochrysis_galbana.AAC.1